MIYYTKKASAVVKLKNNIKGMTLIEILLVVVIASLFLLMGIKLYQSYRKDIDAEQLKYNVNLIFQALGNFYSSNCRENYDDNGNPIKIGLLDPNHYSKQGTMPIQISVDIPKQLIDAGFLKINWPIPSNPFVDNDAGDENLVYIAQFNRKDPPPERMQEMSEGKLKSVGKIYLWTAQVAVKIIDSQHAKLYQGILGADCISGLVTHNIVLPCDFKNLGGKGNYLVWERLPSFAAPGMTSDLWPSIPLVVQFTQMYTTYPIQYILNGTIQDQNYLCGG